MHKYNIYRLEKIFDRNIYNLTWNDPATVWQDDSYHTVVTLANMSDSQRR